MRGLAGTGLSECNWAEEDIERGQEAAGIATEAPELPMDGTVLEPGGSSTIVSSWKRFPFDSCPTNQSLAHGCPWKSGLTMR